MGQTMKVFLCWSGALSKAVAQELNSWLPDVIQGIVPFFSEEDIDAGTVWFNEIDEKLAETSFGILCITKSNTHSHWMHYEAGGLRKGLGKNRVVPLLIDIGQTDLDQPLGSLNNVDCNKAGVRKLLESINNNIGEGKLETNRLDRHYVPLQRLLVATCGFSVL